MPEQTNIWLEDVKRNNITRLVSYLNSIGSSIVNSYPMAEVQSWPVQKIEAEAIIAAGNSSLPSMAPFLAKVCIAQFGTPVSELTLINQVREKALAVKANADSWASLSAYVNGVRARATQAINDATTESDCHRILSETSAEVETFRRAHQI